MQAFSQLRFSLRLTKRRWRKSKKIEVASVVIAEPVSYDFGSIDIFGGKVTTLYTLKNTGAEDVTILSGVTSCMCTEGQIDDLTFGMHESSGTTITIPAGGEKILKAIYDPRARSGGRWRDKAGYCAQNKFHRNAANKNCFLGECD